METNEPMFKLYYRQGCKPCAPLQGLHRSNPGFSALHEQALLAAATLGPLVLRQQDSGYTIKSGGTWDMDDAGPGVGEVHWGWAPLCTRVSLDDDI